MKLLWILLTAALLIFMVTIPLLLDGWVRLVLWMGGRI